jgi:outer membrane protein assembly factor BamB
MARLSLSLLIFGLTLIVPTGCGGQPSPFSDLAPAPSGIPVGTTDWPQFRGPNRDGISPDKGLLAEWPEKGPRMIWKAGNLGIGFSSVCISGNRIFTMGDQDNSSFVVSIDRSTGKKLWAKPVGQAGGNYRGTRCTPTIDGGRVYAIGQFGDLVCLQAETGKEVWRKKFDRDFKGALGGWNCTESPLIDGDKLICTPGGMEATLIALDKKTGDVIWKSPIGGSAGYASMVVSEAAGRRQYVQLLADGVVSVDADTGKLLWRYNKYAGNTANVPNPIALADQVFCTSGYGKGGALLSITPEGAKLNAGEEYYKGELGNRHGGVVRVGDFIYGDRDDSGHLWCAEWKTGKVIWSARDPKQGRGSIALVYADGHLYCRYNNGVVALVEASPRGYAEKGALKIPNSDSESWNHPVVIDGKLYLREKDLLWCYDLKVK